MLTARDTVGDRVTGLDAGADDYLVKPFAYEELAARLRALGRRGATASAGPSRSSSSGPIVLDETSRRVTARRQVDRPQPARVLAARVPPPPSRPDAVARPAPRPGLAVQRGRDAERGRRLRPLPAREARVGGQADRDRARRGLSSRRCLTGSCHRPRRPRRNSPPRPPTAGWSGTSGATSSCGAAGRRCSSSSSSASRCTSRPPARSRAPGSAQLDARIGDDQPGERPDPDDDDAATASSSAAAGRDLSR